MPRLYSLDELRLLLLHPIQVTLDPSNLEAIVRDHLNTHAPRALAVLEPLKVTLTYFPPKDVVQVGKPR